MTPKVPAMRTSLWAATVGKSRSTRPAGPDDELADARCLVLAAGRILRPEPLVVVVVPVDDDVGAGPVERVPERPDRGVVAVLAGAEPRVVPDRHACTSAVDALRSAASQRPWADPGRQPPTNEQSESRTITCHAPRSYEYQLAVRRPGRLAEVAAGSPARSLVSQSWFPAAGRVRSR